MPFSHFIDAKLVFFYSSLGGEKVQDTRYTRCSVCFNTLYECSILYVSIKRKKKLHLNALYMLKQYGPFFNVVYNLTTYTMRCHLNLMRPTSMVTCPVSKLIQSFTILKHLKTSDLCTNTNNVIGKLIP